MGQIILIRKDTTGIQRYFHVRYRNEMNILKTVTRTSHSLCLILKEDEAKIPLSSDIFDYNEQEEVENLNPTTTESKVLKVKLQNLPVFEIKDIKK